MTWSASVATLSCRIFLAGLLTVLPLTAGQAQQQRHNSLFPSKNAGQNAPAASQALRNPRRQTVPLPRPDTVPLPFNLVWGDTENRLASLFAGVAAQVTNKKKTGEVETWTVQGLIAPNLQNSFFTFDQGILVALEFDYGQPSWELAKYNDMMGQFRKLLEAACAKPGEIISRETDQPAAADNGVKQSLMGYQWKRGDTLVQLFYFSAEDPAKSLSYRSISVHYHYQNPYEVPAAAGAPGEVTPAGGANSPANPSLFPQGSASAPPQGSSAPVSPDTDALPEK